MARIIITIVLVLLVVRALWRLVGGILEGAGYGRLDSAPPAGVKLVRDPICGVYVAPSRALIAREGGETAYFCSEKCRRAWERR